MATYFHGSNSTDNIQPDGLQTLILMNPATAAYVNYSETQHQQLNHHRQEHHQDQPGSGNYVFLNSTAGGGGAVGGYSLAQPHHTHQANHEISSLYGFIPRSWNSSDVQVVPQTQQGLSLSLSSSQPPVGFGSLVAKHELPIRRQLSAAKVGEEMRISGGSPSSTSGISNGVSGIQNALLSSKYLKAAQQVLDEVVNVVSSMKPDGNKKISGHSKEIGESSVTGGLNSGETISKHVAELSTSEKQEVQMKKAKLLSMLDEVEQRYRHYHHQMQIVISSFEKAAGNGSAKTYTALASQTISKKFRCLKDTIAGQIRAASKSLGEEDCLGGKTEGSSRLKFVDHQIRQQRALQQLGMVQHNTWRPQRGLPERSVSVLRAWLFEHFLHPYPKDSDKHILAKQTGLTRSQVSNWFINARVRLWKPMVEEMYLEEVKENEKNGTEDKSEHKNDSASKSTSLKKTSPVLDHDQSFKSKQENPPINQNISTISASTDISSPPGFGLIGYTELDGITQSSPKKQRNTEMMHYMGNMQSMNMDMKPNEINNEQVSMKFGLERQDRDGYSLMGGPANFIGGFGSYPMGEIGRYETEHYQPPFSGNAVSLTLGLPDGESLSLSGGTNQSFFNSQNIQLGRRVELTEPNMFSIVNAPSPSQSTPTYENINIQNRKRFATQLLPDFVA